MPNRYSRISYQANTQFNSHSTTFQEIMRSSSRTIWSTAITPTKNRFLGLADAMGSNLTLLYSLEFNFIRFRRFGHVYNNQQTQLTKTLLHAVLDPKRAMTQHYGANSGFSSSRTKYGTPLSYFFYMIVRLLVVPNLEPYLRLLESEMLLEKQKNEIKRHEAWRVYGALLLHFVCNGFVMLSSMRSPKMGYMLHLETQIRTNCTMAFPVEQVGQCHYRLSKWVPDRFQQLNFSKLETQIRIGCTVAFPIKQMELDQSTVSWTK
ncbi:Transcription initiation factor TFIID subunit 6 [Vitis vinifera]|uniref:Transcription initiation factor TFIID subunit 6 n=1 Tax=Vitis vinifera TaxID=29760 RepID=A0A438ILE4_VITVI|nr:Transcription initiation factor TFIID subunit 6 [Vitis vinifera]